MIRILGDFDRAEEALQEAFAIALEKWPKEGIPKNPIAWLVSTGKFKGIDVLRRDNHGKKLIIEKVIENKKTFSEPKEWDEEILEDDQLRLIFTCCHPHLSIEARIALSLKVVCRMKTEEIARAYLISIEAMKRRITRAKAQIREKRIPYEIPSKTELAKRLDAVLHVIYLIYNEGYSATIGNEYIKNELSKEAVFLIREIVKLLPNSEAMGLLALLLLHESRSKTRIDSEGNPIPLELQDRSKWNKNLISEAMRLIQKSMMSGRIGQYTIQAAIASVHASASSVKTTNWELIIYYYKMLLSLIPSPIIELQLSIAIGMKDGYKKGKELIEELLKNNQLKSYYQAYVAHANFAEKSGDNKCAIESLNYALKYVHQEPEKRFIKKKLKKILEK